MMWTKTGARLLVAATVVVATACSSSSGSGASGSKAAGDSGTKTGAAAADPHEYTLGLLTDLTGAAAAVKDSVQGVKAGVGAAKAKGYKIKYVVADGGSTPTGAVAAAHKLVEQDHVDAVIAISDLTFAAAPYLTAQGIPVIGGPIDGGEWITSKNMFSVMGSLDYSKVTTTIGDFLKLKGAKNFASVGYTVPPSSNLNAKGAAGSAKAVGIKVGYLNAQMPLGSTNVGPLAIAMHDANVDSYYGAIFPASSFALLVSLQQKGTKMTAALLPVGYGGDLINGDPATKKAAQGVYFSLTFEPVEMQTPGTKRLVAALRTYAGVTTPPGLNEYLGYVSVDAFVTALTKTGSNPSKSKLIDALLGMTDYDAAGLIGSHTIDFSMAGRDKYFGPENCEWVTQFSGDSFHVVKDAAPLCGKNVPGAKIS